MELIRQVRLAVVDGIKYMTSLDQTQPDTTQPNQDPNVPQGLDPTAFYLTKAIRQTETAGSPDAYTMPGKSGEYGAYQYTNDTWNADSEKYLGTSVPLNQATPAQQNQVAYNKVKDLLAANGGSQSKVASIWNSGQPDPNTVGTGTNKEGVAYDVPGYVERVKQNYLGYQNGTTPSQPSSPTDQNTQGEDTTTVGQTPNTGTLGTNPNDDLTGKILNNSITRFIQAAFPGKEVGQSIGTLAGYGVTAIKEKLGLVPKGTTDAYDLSAPTPLQTAADAANIVASTVGGEAIGGIETGIGRIAATAGVSALSGAAGTIAGGDNSIKDVGTNAAIGGVVGGALGGISEGVSAIKGSLASKTGDELAAMARDPNVSTKDVAKLSPSEQEQYYKEKTAAVKEEATNQRTSRQQSTDAALAQNKQEIQDFTVKAGESARGETTDLKQPLQKLLKDSSNTYQQLVEEGVSSGKGMEDTQTKEDFSSDIDSEFEHDKTGLGDEIKSDLGLNKPEAAPENDEETGLPTITAESTPEPTITNQQKYDYAKGLMQDISKGARSGNQVYSAAEYRNMQKYSFIMKNLGENGVDLTEANKFWREWSPVRNRAVAEIKPFDSQNVGKMPFESTLKNAGATPKTVPQVKAQGDAQNFISQLETRLNLPKGSIGSETRDALQKMDQAKLNKLDIEQIGKDAQDAIARDKAKAVNSIGRDKYDANKVARSKAIVKKYLLGALGALGAGTSKPGREILGHII